METTEQKINLQLNIDGYKFFETNQSFDDDQTYSNLIQGFMDDLDYKLENMNDSEDEPVDEELYDKIIPNKKLKLQISINIDVPEKEANSIISDIRFIYDRNSLVKDIYNMLNESSLNIQDINKVIDIVRSKF
jgi:tRNA(Ile2) C34 agmatinyltransferase TiaS